MIHYNGVTVYTVNIKILLKVPIDNDTVILDGEENQLLLSGETARLKSLTIKNGARLIFDPDSAKVKLTSDHILVQDEGHFEVGGPNCPFEGQEAEILLTGERLGDGGQSGEVAGFGQKFLGVEAGGSVEIHGRVRGPAWTRLNRTLMKKVPAFYFDDSLPAGDVKGFLIYEFDPLSAELRWESRPLSTAEVNKKRNFSETCSSLSGILE